MADYAQPDVVQKRVRFFDGQFLQDQDFIDEQKYHLDRERRQSKLLRVTGITEGLTVTTSGAYQVTVTKGMAVDGLGRHLVLTTDTDLRLTDKFARKQDVELFLIYQESATDVAQTGGKSARRWDESPKIAALAPDGTVAVAPDGASSTWDGPTVRLARLAVADSGAVTVDRTAARSAGLSVPGAVGVGTSSPAAKLEVSGAGGLNVDLLVNGRLRSNSNDGGLWIAEDRFVGGHSSDQLGFWSAGGWRLTVQRNGNIGVGTTDPENTERWNRVVDILGTGNAKLSVRTASVDARVLAHDSGFWGSPAGMVVGTGSNHALSLGTNATTRLSISAAGAVSVGTSGSSAKLAVGAADTHLELLRESTEKTGGAQLYLELAQRDPSGKNVPEVAPNIRFHHHNRFWHRIEAQSSGFHLKNGNLASGEYSDLKARNIYATGSLEVTGSGGTNVDLLVNGRLRSNNNDGGLWISDDRFVGGHSTSQIGFWNGGLWRLTVQKNGNVGIGTTNPGSDLEIGNFDARDRYLTLKVAGGNKYRSGIKLWTWQENYGYSLEYDERGAAGNGLHIRAHDKNADGTTRFFVGWNGNVGVGTTGPPAKLTVSAEDDHLQLRRESTETAGGKKMFLELYQDDPDPKKLVPEVFPSIRFHHSNRFWHRLEVRGDGFHFKTGNLSSDNYSDVTVQDVTARKVASSSLSLGSVTIGESELEVLKKLANGNLEFDLYNTKQGEYIYASDYAPYDNDRRRVFTWRQGNRVNQGRWRIHYPS